MRGLKITERITGRETESFKSYLKEVAKIELFPSHEAEIECATRAFEYKKLMDESEDKMEIQLYSDQYESAIEEIVKRNLRFVVSVAKQYQRKDVPLEDLVNEGNCGLMEAARRYDPTAGYKFISYAVWYIRKDIMQYLTKSSRTIKLPVNKVNSLVDFGNKVSELKQKLGRDIDIEDLLGNVEGYTDKAIKDMYNIQNTTIKSMDATFSSDDGDSGTLYDVLENTDTRATDHIIDDEYKNNTIESMLSCLSIRAKTVLKMYYGIGYNESMNLNEIGIEIGLTREGVRQIKEKSLRLVRARAKRLGYKQDLF